MPATSEVETVIKSLKAWAAALKKIPDFTDSKLETSPPDPTSDKILACYGHQRRPSQLLEHPGVRKHLTLAIESLFTSGRNADQVLQLVKEFLVSVVQIGSMPHRRRELSLSELNRDLKQISVTSIKLLKHLNGMRAYLADSDDIGYLKARRSAGNPDRYRSRDGFFLTYSVDGTTLRDLLPSLTGSIEDLRWSIAQSIAKNRKANSSGSFSVLVLKRVSREIETTFCKFIPALAIEITNVLHKKAIDPSHAYRTLKPKTEKT